MRNTSRGWGWDLAYRISRSKVIWTTLGVPSTIIAGLGYHILYRHYVQTPDPIKIQVILYNKLHLSREEKEIKFRHETTRKPLHRDFQMTLQRKLRAE